MKTVETDYHMIHIIVNVNYIVRKLETGVLRISK